VLQASPLLPHVKGYFIFGTAPLGYAPELPPPSLSPAESYAGPAVQYGAVGPLPDALIADYVTAFFRPGFPSIPNFFFEDGYRTDPNTRAAILNAGIGADPTFRDEVAIIRNLQVPVAVVLGAEDAFVRPAYLEALAPSIQHLWMDKVLTVPKTGHAIQWERADLLVSMLRTFVDDVDPSCRSDSDSETED
jgi:pimeloyl-ACP methyl ester carboxylesterase